MCSKFCRYRARCLKTLQAVIACLPKPKDLAGFSKLTTEWVMSKPGAFQDTLAAFTNAVNNVIKERAADTVASLVPDIQKQLYGTMTGTLEERIAHLDKADAGLQHLELLSAGAQGGNFAAMCRSWFRLMKSYASVEQWKAQGGISRCAAVESRRRFSALAVQGHTLA